MRLAAAFGGLASLLAVVAALAGSAPAAERIRTTVIDQRVAVFPASLPAYKNLTIDPASRPELRAQKADQNGDKIFDDLAARLERMESADRLSVIVRMAGDLTSARAVALERAVGAFDLTRWLPIVDGFAATMTKAQVEALAGVDGVAMVESNAVVHAYNDSAQAAFGVTKARLDVPSLDGGDGNPAYSAADIVIAVVDTGIDATHPQLDDGKVIGFANCLDQPTPASCTTPAPFDDNDHGTHVAGTIAGDGEGDARYKGVAPAAALVGVKVLGATGSGSEAGVISGIQWVVQNKAALGIEVLNLSLGANGCWDGSDAGSAAVNAAVAAGIVTVVAAGNDGPATCTVGSPGVATDVITVGAMADTGVPHERNPVTGALRARVPGFNQASFSSRGPTMDGRIKPDVSAPGVHITSADANSGGGYVVFQGTSMATPFTAGVAALMLDQNPALTHGVIKSTLMSTAIDWGRGDQHQILSASGPDIDYGAGRLDAFAALKAVGAPLGAAPSVPQHALLTGNLPGTPGAFADHYFIVADPTVPLAATLIMTQWTDPVTPDFDLRLFNPDGVEVAAPGLYTTRQEEVGVVPGRTGVFRIRVERFSGGGPYILDVSGGTPTSAPPPPPLPPPPPPPPPPPTTPACPPTDVAVGGTYRGTHSGGRGSVCLTVTPGWTGVISFLITDIPGNICTFLWSHTRPPTPLPITNRSFNAGSLNGSFPSDRGAQGTTVISAGFPVCSTGTVNWTATTDGTPPWVVPPAPPPPLRQPVQARCLVPNVKGKTVARARSMLRARRCALGRVTRKYSNRVRQGKIIAQSRRPGARLPRGTRVNVVVSRGRRR